VTVAILIAVVYLAAAWTMLRSVEARRLDPLAWILTVVALIGHSALLVHELRSVGPWSIGVLEALSLLGWTLAVIGSFIASFRRHRILTTILLISAAFGTVATTLGVHYSESAVPGWELTAHIVLSIGAAALLFAAAVTAALLVVLDRRLRGPRLANMSPALPPIDTLESVQFRLIGAGFALLTLSLFTGFVFVTNLFAQHLIHKTVLSLAAWLVFGILLIGRARFGWRGRTARRWTLIGCGVLGLAYFGSKYVLEHLLGKHWG
jgi:ABC-type uncharacterized transport system permease subunit